MCDTACMAGVEILLARGNHLEREKQLVPGTVLPHSVADDSYVKAKVGCCSA